MQEGHKRGSYLDPDEGFESDVLEQDYPTSLSNDKDYISTEDMGADDYTVAGQSGFRGQELERDAVDAQVYERFTKSSADDVVSQRGAYKIKVIGMVAVFAFVIYVIVLFFRATSELDVEAERKKSSKANIPQDLNISDNSITWMNTKDAEIEQLRRELNLYKAGVAGTAAEANNSAQRNAYGNIQPQAPALTQEQIASIVRDEVRKSRPAMNNFAVKPLPSLVMQEPKRLPKQIQRIAGRDGNPKDIDVNEFLSVSPNENQQLPATVQEASQAGAKMLPPATTAASAPSAPAPIQIPQLGGQEGSPIMQRSASARIVDAPDLKTGYATTTTESKNKPSYYLMSGMAKASLYTGFNAATLALAEKQPPPVFLSVDSNIISANNSNMDIRDCTVMGTAKGNLSTSRAEIRLDELNCAVFYKNGKKGRITEKINGWVYGEDGVFGIKGRLVTNDGKIIKAALPISLIQALIGALSQADGLSQLVIPGVGTATAATEAMSGGERLQKSAATGFGKGASQSLNQVVSYYMDMLREMNPAIEVLGGRTRLTILFKGGENLKEQDFNPVNLEAIKGGKK